MKGVVVVADNPLIVAAIRNGLRESPALKLLGYVDPREATVGRIIGAGADVVLVDEADCSELSIALIRALKEDGAQIHVIALVLALKGDWLQRSFDAGANGAICKAVHPAALAILVREAVAGHIVHAPTRLRVVGTARVEFSGDHLSLTDRELEILRLVSSGATNGVIARQLWITQQTVKFHVSNIYRKLGVANRTEACHYAHMNRIAVTRDPLVGESCEALANAS
ncbi:MAG: LuxR C-terminal-related transcriptional regulator [Solirubrobacteraceae bacterium]